MPESYKSRRYDYFQEWVNEFLEEYILNTYGQEEGMPIINEQWTWIHVGLPELAYWMMKPRSGPLLDYRRGKLSIQDNCIELQDISTYKGGRLHCFKHEMFDEESKTWHLCCCEEFVEKLNYKELVKLRIKRYENKEQETTQS